MKYNMFTSVALHGLYCRQGQLCFFKGLVFDYSYYCLRAETEAAEGKKQFSTDRDDRQLIQISLSHRMHHVTYKKNIKWQLCKNSLKPFINEKQRTRLRFVKDLDWMIED